MKKNINKILSDAILYILFDLWKSVNLLILKDGRVYRGHDAESQAIPVKS